MSDICLNLDRLRSRPVHVLSACDRREREASLVEHALADRRCDVTTRHKVVAIVCALAASLIVGLLIGGPTFHSQEKKGSGSSRIGRADSSVQ